MHQWVLLTFTGTKILSISNTFTLKIIDATKSNKSVSRRSRLLSALEAVNDVSKAIGCEDFFLRGEHGRGETTQFRYRVYCSKIKEAS